MKDLKEFIGAERARLEAEFEPGSGMWVPNGRMLDAQSQLLDRLEAWVPEVPPYNRQNVDATKLRGIIHLVDRRFEDHTLCGLWLAPSERSGWMLQFCSSCAVCDEEFARLNREKGTGS